MFEYQTEVCYWLGTHQNEAEWSISLISVDSKDVEVDIS